ncbi:hypothetical protein [Perigonia lusca single nucleopolyhedrovirus]|uniref:Ac110 n=1 Tax=Perigonia lusca single nucleopolyhedrovirus TaxID=1675865 RepID=A0A0M3WNV3_9ABAC|nr:hypothetical protein [Perigonia lusca single nucleopolyhedrovirus]AKN80591.1 hypothetical protein [Perigonia lusca single nucleopolyhedrovirus]
MIVFIVFVIVSFFVALAILFTLRLNKKLVENLVYYQYNYIPQPLVKHVKVFDLKQ